jgi:hypothetical protein
VTERKKFKKLSRLIDRCPPIFVKACKPWQGGSKADCGNFSGCVTGTPRGVLDDTFRI